MTESKNYKVYEQERALKVLIPRTFADQLGIKARDSVTWTLSGDQLIMRKARDPGFRADIDKAIKER